MSNLKHAILQESLQKLLSDALEEELITNVRKGEFVILPNGEVPTTIGQTCISLDIESDYTYYIESQDFVRINFKVYLIKRTREVPHDRLSELTNDKRGIVGTHLDIRKLICSPSFLKTFKSNLQAVGSSTTSIFMHQYTKIAPVPLPPSYFLRNQTSFLNDKIAGFKTWQNFLSPNIYDLIPNYNCTPN